MADSNDITASDVVAQKAIRIGLGIHIDQRDIDRDMDPVLKSISKKLKVLSEDSNLKNGIFGKNFFTDKIKNLTGLDLTLFKSTQTMIAYGRASKEMGADNKEFYNTLNPIQKAMVDIAGLFDKKAKAEKKSTEQTKESKEQLADLQQVMNTASKTEAYLNKTEGIEGALGALGNEATTAAGSVEGLGVAAEGTGAAMAAMGVVATAGLALVAVALAGLVVGFYKMFMSAVTARDEIKKFDQLFGGVGHDGIVKYAGKIQSLNRDLWSLGFSIEKVNEVSLSAIQQGLNADRAMNSVLVGNVLTLSGATGVAASEIGNLYTELLKTTKIGNDSLQEMSDSFIQINRTAEKTTTLGQVSFATFREAITSSSNALAIATAKGKTFTDGMTKDLTALSELATTLSLSIGELNGKFEEAGSMLTSPDSGFRTLLAISGGANINQMLTNQFDKTDAMLKGVRYLQEFNKGFGGNIQITAQVAERSLGISKEMAIKMINMRQETINDMVKAQAEISSLQSQSAKDAFEKVNSDLSSMWNRVKTMFVTFFQNAFGNNGGMQGLLAKVEEFLNKFKNYMTSAGWVEKLRVVIGNLATWVADKLDPLLDWIGEKLDQFMNPDVANPLVALWEGIKDMLFKNAMKLGLLIGAGMAIGFNPILAAIALGVMALSGSEEVSEPRADKSYITSLYSEVSAHKARLAELKSQEDRLSKYNPETVTYGKTADGKPGFMTVGQKEDLIQKEKAEEQKKITELQSQIADNTKKAADSLEEIKNKNKEHQALEALPDAASPIGASRVGFRIAQSFGHGH